VASSVSWKGISRARAEGVAVSDDKSACGFDFLHDFVGCPPPRSGLCSVNTQLLQRAEPRSRAANRASRYIRYVPS